MKTATNRESKMDITKLTAGTEVFYTGDMANLEDYGVITAIVSDKWYPVSYNIRLDDGREMRSILPQNFSGAGRRFWVRSEHTAVRRAKFVKMLESVDCTEAEKAQSLANFDANNR